VIGKFERPKMPQQPGAEQNNFTGFSHTAAQTSTQGKKKLRNEEKNH